MHYKNNDIYEIKLIFTITLLMKLFKLHGIFKKSFILYSTVRIYNNLTMNS